MAKSNLAPFYILMENFILTVKESYAMVIIMLFSTRNISLLEKTYIFTFTGILKLFGQQANIIHWNTARFSEDIEFNTNTILIRRRLRGRGVGC